MRDVTKEMIHAEAAAQTIKITRLVQNCAWDGEEITSFLEGIKNAFACKAAGIMGDDPSKIESLVWYKHDGWNHGGHAITWKDRAEELEAEVKQYEKRLEFLAEGPDFNVDRGTVGHSDKYYVGDYFEPVGEGLTAEDAIDEAMEWMEKRFKDIKAEGVGSQDVT